MKTKTNKTEGVVALWVAGIGTILLTSLLVYRQIGEASFVVLLCALGLVCLVINGFSRLLELDLKNLKMTLDRIEEAKAEVLAKETDLKNITIALTRIIAFTSALSGKYSSAESVELQREWHRIQTKKLLSILPFDEATRREILKYDVLNQRIKDLKTQEEKENFRDELLKTIQEDIEHEKASQ